jgi:hypothetical protein
MAKYQLRLKARELRERGVSVKQIAQELNIAKSTASLWVRDIILSIEQLEALRNSSLQGAERGRLKSALIQKEKWNTGLDNYRKLGIEKIGHLNDRELLIAGLALYWAEGSKKERAIQFCNSDPKMVQFLLLWLRRCFAIKDQEIYCRVGINEIHEERDDIVKAYWAKVTCIPLEQFRKTSLKKVTNKKVYDNFDSHFGTLSIKVRQPARFYGKIIGLIEGLAEGNRQGSSVG